MVKVARPARRNIQRPAPVAVDQKALFKGALSFRGIVALAIKALPAGKEIGEIVVDLAAWKLLNTLAPERIADLGRAEALFVSRDFTALGLRVRRGSKPETTVYIMGDPENIKALERLSAHKPDEATLALRRFSNLLID
ncbi:MAG: hypothetical protein WC529_01885 [Candidatus Margulisiibacteriota bacterium]